MEPVAQMVGLTPGRGPLAAGHRTAAVADDQGGPLGGGDDPAGAADLQRLGRGAAKGRGEPGRRHPQPGRQAVIAAGVRGGLGWSVAGDQDPGDRPVTGQPPTRLRVQRPAPPVSPPSPPGWPRRLSRSTVTSSWGRTPPVWGSRPASRVRRASSARASARRWPPLRSSLALVGRASGSRAASRVWPASGSSSPFTATMPSQVGDSHNPRCCWRRSAWSVGAVGVGHQPQMGDRPPQPGRVQTAGRFQQDWFGLGGEVVGEILGAGGQHLGVRRGDGPRRPRPGRSAVRGPRYRARAVRTMLAAVPAPMRSRRRSQAAVEPAWTPCSAPAAPRASTPASSASHWPSRRSTSPRNTRTRSAQAPSASPSGSWAARPWSSATSAANPAGVPADGWSNGCSSPWRATYQPLTRTQAPPPHLGTSSPTRAGSSDAWPPGPGQPPCQATALAPTAPDPDPPRQPPARDPTAPAPYPTPAIRFPSNPDTRPVRYPSRRRR